MTHDIAAGDSYLSTHDPRLHFGLGDAETADEVVVAGRTGRAPCARTFARGSSWW